MSYLKNDYHIPAMLTRWQKAIVCVVIASILAPHCAAARFTVPSATAMQDSTAVTYEDLLQALPDSIIIDDDASHAVGQPLEVVEQAISTGPGDTVSVTASDTIPVITAKSGITEYNTWERRPTAFNPDPTRAVWMSALFPGLGQIYNRRYWKLPIVVGAYVGLGYGCSWNNSMLSDYTRAYRDIMDNDPSTNSYMDLFPSTTREEDLDKTWLTNVLRTRKDYYRRNRDLCIICMIGVYLIAMVDAYVDASLSHFDISPDLAIDVAPAVMQETRSSRPAIGLSWALTF